MNRSTSILPSLGLLVAVACGTSETPPSDEPAAGEVRTVRIHFDGFTKSKSGAT